MAENPGEVASGDRQERILDAALRLLSAGGISAVSIRAVAREAGVALGLVNYYFDDKTGLVRAALLSIEAKDIGLVTADLSGDPEQQLRTALRRVAAAEYLTTEYLSLRLQLWSLAQAHQEYAQINTNAQKHYRQALARLIGAARPDLTRSERSRRAADIDVVQNGLWLSALLGIDKAAIRRAVERCEQIALEPSF